MSITNTCPAGLSLNSTGSAYSGDVVRVHLWPLEDSEAPVPTSLLVQVDTAGGYALGEEYAVKAAIDFADRLDGAMEDHFGWINWRPEGEGPAVEIVQSPRSPGGPRPGERALVCRTVSESLARRRVATTGGGEAIAPLDGRAHGRDENEGDGPYPAY